MSILHHTLVLILTVCFVLASQGKEDICANSLTGVKGLTLIQNTTFCVFKHDIKYKAFHIFSSSKLTTNPPSVSVATGFSKDEAVNNLEEGQSPLNWWKLFNSNSTQVSLDPCHTSYVAVSNAENFKIKITEQWIDKWYITIFSLGVLLFLLAPKLSRNAVFFYGTGVSIGMLASLLILLFILSRLVPKRNYAVYGILLAGWSAAVTCFSYVVSNIQLILTSYFYVFAAYLAIAGITSFAICYWYGPPTEPRRVQLIQWSLQLLASGLLFMSIQLPEAFPPVLLLLILIMHGPNIPSLLLPRFVSIRIWAYWHRLFPPKVKLLSEDEYVQQGREETMKELDKLREFCRSPNCDAWKTVSRLKNPTRFASFIEGESEHLSEEEFNCFEETSGNSLPADLETDDDSNASGDGSFMISPR